MKRSAVLSDDGRYRYELWRTDLLGGLLAPRSLGTAVFCMLNPSTADAEVDDPTVRRCIGYARRWGYDTLAVVNLYPLRATSPADLHSWRYDLEDAGGQDAHEARAAVVRNYDTIRRVASYGQLCVAGWGVHGHHTAAAATVERGTLHRSLRWWCLGTTKDGAPKHPLYQPLNASLVQYVPLQV